MDRHRAGLGAGCGCRRRAHRPGGAYGGWSFYAKDGNLAFAYNLLGIDVDIVRSDSPVPTGEQEVRAHFAYDGGGLAKGGTVTLYAGEQKIGEGRVEKTIPFQFTFDETVDVGCDLASPVSPDYGATGNGFTGTIEWVRIDLGDDDPLPPDRRRAQAQGRHAQQ